MKILHTADWHAGRVLKGQDRTPEIRDALQEVAEVAKQHEVDLILVAGDVYDKKNPSAEAEAAVYEFFLSVGEAGIPSVVIAGNHDRPSRLDAVSGLLGKTQACVVGEAKVAGEGGLFELNVNGELARVAALPFVSERRIVRYADLLGHDPGQWTERYRRGMKLLIDNLTADFTPDAVNLLLLHTTMEGATLTNSEYSFHCGDSYTLSHDLLPERANYVALGHIHKPQPIQNFPEQAGRYAGSLIQLDFGEAGSDKHVYIVEAKAGKPTELLDIHTLKSGKPLKNVRIDVGKDELDKKLHAVADFGGWLKLSIQLDRPRPGLKDRIKQQLPNALAVEFSFPEAEAVQVEKIDADKLDLVAAYRQFYEAQQAKSLDDDLKRLFVELLEERSDEVGAEAA